MNDRVNELERVLRFIAKADWEQFEEVCGAVNERDRELRDKAHLERVAASWRQIKNLPIGSVVYPHRDGDWEDPYAPHLFDQLTISRLDSYGMTDEEVAASDLEVVSLILPNGKHCHLPAEDVCGYDIRPALPPTSEVPS